MYVLSELLKLPTGRQDLPLPWYLRSSIGFLSNTSCHITFIQDPQGKGRPVPDIVVSVLDPVVWDNMIRIDCSHDDGPGVFGGAFQAVGKANIALAESITTNEGTAHAVTLICEMNEQGCSSSEIQKRLEANGFEGVTVNQFHPQQNVVWADVGIVERGWICQSKWREEFKRRYGAIAEAHNIDLTRVVVTVDTATRALRYVFPRKGARNISIEHADTPGALDILTNALVSANVNLLSAILRRGGAKPRNAVLMATAEPKDGLTTGDPSARIREKIDSISVRFRPQLKIHDGIEAFKVIWAHDPDVVVAKCPSALWHRVVIERRRLPKGKIPIFFSRRFTHQSRGEMIAKLIREVAAKCGCVLLESDPELGQAPVVIHQEVGAKMWLAEGGIVLVVGSGDKSHDDLGRNLPHECGFLQGQSKPTLLLVEGGHSDALRGWSNICGIHAPRFATEMDTFDTNHPRCVSNVVADWITSFKEHRLLN